MNHIKLDQLLADYSVIYWDFDGVIKESVQIKINAYLKLFSDTSAEIIKRIKKHSQDHGGLSRHLRIPLYLEWNGIEVSESIVREYENKFSKLVVQQVIDSEWVPGVIQFLKKKEERHQFILISGTPHEELIEIIDKLNIGIFFNQMFGAPAEKNDIVRDLQNSFSSPVKSIFIGDSKVDWLAAKENNIDFLLRSTNIFKENPFLFKGYVMEDFHAEELLQVQ